MKRSTERILTTHIGSLPRPPELWTLLQARDRGESYDRQAFAEQVRSAVKEVVRQQAEAGLDVVDDGEMGKNSFVNYVKDRLSGLEGENTQPYPGPPDPFPEFTAWQQAQFPGTLARGKPPLNTGPLAWRDRAEIDTDLGNLKAALQGVAVEEAFMPAVAPGQVLMTIPSVYYPSDQAYLYALADVLKDEYRAIVDAGFVLQVDSPDVPMMRNRQLWDVSFEDYRKHLALRLEALNHALQGIPEERVRFHVCWGNFEGPHHNDVPLRDIVDLVLTVKAQAYSVEAANPRHAHEWEVWQEVKLPEGKVVIPGVIDTVTNFVEAPELVAQRIVRYAELVGRENVIAAPDCGFATFSARAPRVHPQIMWAKFRALVDGARLASTRLWS